MRQSNQTFDLTKVSRPAHIFVEGKCRILCDRAFVVSIHMIGSLDSHPQIKGIAIAPPSLIIFWA
jgi:hypothetical protein